jgi:hypothetical protein
MRTARRLLLIGATLAGLTACGSSDGNPSGTHPDTDSTTVKCYDAAGKPTDTCPTQLVASTCATGDANDCLAPELVEFYADDGKNGMCAHLVLRNVCDSTIYSIECIDMPARQCWWSTTVSGLAVDVSQCGLTSGKLAYVANRSSGVLQLQQEKCGLTTH